MDINIMHIINDKLLENIRNIVSTVRQQGTINAKMLETYWNIGRVIIEEEQKGQARAEYGAKQLEILSKTL